MRAHPEALNYYNKTIVKAKWVRRTRLLLVGCGISAAVSGYIFSQAELGSTKFYLFLSSTLPLSVLTIAMIPISIIQSTLKAKYRKKSIRLFNETEILENGYSKNTSFLQLGLSENRVGLFYSF